MMHYKIRIESPDGCRSFDLEMDRPDDMAALDTALEICRNQKVEVWEGARRIGAVSLSGTPHLTV